MTNAITNGDQPDKIPTITAGWGIRFVAIVFALFAWPAAALEIHAPTDPVPTGQYLILEVDGLVPGCESDLDCWPNKGVIASAEQTYGRQQQPVVLFRASSPGSYRLGVWAVIDGHLVTSKVVLTVAGDVEPPVPPDPPPPPIPPDPPPPIVVEQLHVIIVEESADRTPEQAKVLLSKAVRDYLTSVDGVLHIVDQDVTDGDGNMPSTVAGWIQRAKDKTLPWLFLVDENGREVASQALPTTPETFLELLTKYGGEAKKSTTKTDDCPTGNCPTTRPSSSSWRFRR